MLRSAGRPLYPPGPRHSKPDKTPSATPCVSLRSPCARTGNVNFTDPREDHCMTKVILVRHGHVEGISPERFRGRADLSLTPQGYRQAAATARRVSTSWHPAAVYTSPMRRCLATGAAIGQPFSLLPSPLEGLNDIDYGQWQGLTPDEVRSRWPDELDAWYRTPDWAAIPGGESLQDLLSRTVLALRDVVRRHP